MQGSPDRAPALAVSRPDLIDDIMRAYRLVKQIPALPLPTASPARVTFDYRHVTSAWAATLAVIGARTALAREFGVTFTPRTALAGDDTPRYFLEAKLPSGLVLVITSRVQLDGDADPAVSENAGELVAA
jgi:hypothetical protein